MYYTAQTTSGHGGHYCLSRATSSSPAGPFTDNSNGPWLCMDAQGGAIDPSPFVDASGHAWLYFKTYDLVEHGTEPAQIYVVRLSADGMTRTSTPIAVLSQSSLSSPFETVENPQMVNVGGTLMLLYSRGSWSTSSYRQGYAICNSPTGPCHEGQSAFLSSYGNVLGPGGGSIFTDTSGRRWIAYQGWNGTPGCTAAQGAASARKLYVAPLTVKTTRPTPPCHAKVPIAGYRLVASDGGIFTFGNQQFCGSTGNITLNRPDHRHGTDGQWRRLLAGRSDGGIFNFGNAHFYGSAGATHLTQPFVDMVSTPTGHGYWLTNANGSVYSYGDAKYYGSAHGTTARFRRSPQWPRPRPGTATGSSPAPGESSRSATRTRTGRPARSTSRFSTWPAPDPATAIGCSDPTEESLRSATRTSTGRPAASTSTNRSSEWRRRRAARATGSSPGTVASSRSVDARFHGSTGGIHLNQPIVGMS